MRTAIYAGSFDIFTYGHMAIVERALRIFDHVVVLVAISPVKKSVFTCEERVKMIREVYAHDDRVTVDMWQGLTTQYAVDHNIKFLVRGIRPTGDFDSEFMMARINKKISDGVETVFLMADSTLDCISSSMVREVWSFGGPIDQYVPEIIQNALVQKKEAYQNENK